MCRPRAARPPPQSVLENIDAVLEEVSFGFRRTESGWAGSCDTRSFCHRITAGLSEVDGAYALRFETSGQPVKSGGAEVEAAIALFLMEANAQTRLVRFSLTSTAAGALAPVVEAVLPVDLLNSRSANAFLSALVVGGTRVRDEAAALAEAAIAGIYLRFNGLAGNAKREKARHDALCLNRGGADGPY